MTVHQVASALRLQAHALKIARLKMQRHEEFDAKLLLGFTLHLIEELANHKVAQAIMLERLSPYLADVEFNVLNMVEDLAPLGKPPFDLD